MAGKGLITLGEVAARDVATIDIRCGRCDRHGRLSVKRLLCSYGPDASIRDIMREQIGPCPRRNDMQLYTRSVRHTRASRSAAGRWWPKHSVDGVGRPKHPVDRLGQPKHFDEDRRQRQCDEDRTYEMRHHGLHVSGPKQHARLLADAAIVDPSLLCPGSQWRLIFVCCFRRCPGLP